MPMPNHVLRPFSLDRMYMMPRDDAMKAAFALLSKNQDQDPEVQMAGAAILFAAWCSRIGLNPHDAHTYAMRMLKPQEFHVKGNITAETLRDFAGLRIAGDRNVEVPKFGRQ